MINETTTDRQISLKSLWDDVISQNGSTAVWRCPHESTIHFLGDLSESPAKGRIDLQNTDMGFVVSPFMNPNGNETLFLNSDVYVQKMGEGGWRTLRDDGDISGLTGSLTPSYHLNTRPEKKISREKGHFIQMVKDGISAIAGGKFDKVVTARTYNNPLPVNFNVIDQFYRLGMFYPDAFISLVSIPGRGTWMGATPELLVESSNSHFRTVSIAGTQSYPLKKDLSQVAWTGKEIDEQALVSQYIIDQFKAINVRKFKETGPRTVRAGNMIHLKTEYIVDLNEIHFPNLGTVMLHLIHPSASICGIPKFSSLRFIFTHENLNREFYGGYIGPVNLDGVSRLYVNLRCMQILQTCAVLYAGAGITRVSIPEKEWEETTLKCQTLLNVMNGDGSV